MVRLRFLRQASNTDMDFAVATAAECNEVLTDIVTQQASRANMMDLEIVWASAVLASPSVSLQDLSTEFAVGIGIQPEPRSLPS